MSVEKSIKEMQQEIRELKALVLSLHVALAPGAGQPATLPAAGGAHTVNGSFTKPGAGKRQSRKNADLYATGLQLERMGLKGITRFLPKPI